MHETSPAGRGSLDDELGIARVVVDAVQRVPGVAGMSPGRFAEAATYGAGETVRGVVVQRFAGVLGVEVHLRAAYVHSLVLPALADRVRRAIRDAVGTLGVDPIGHIDIAFDDLQIGENAEETWRVNG